MKTKTYLPFLIFPIIILLSSSCRKKQAEDILKNTYKMHGLHTWTGETYFWPFPGNGIDSSSYNYVHDDSIIVIDEKHIVFASDTLYYSFTDTNNKKNIFVYYENYMGLGEIDTLTHYYSKNYIEFIGYYFIQVGNGKTFAHTP
jgi:hypothetical protein